MKLADGLTFLIAVAGLLFALYGMRTVAFADDDEEYPAYKYVPLEEVFAPADETPKLIPTPTEKATPDSETAVEENMNP